MLNITKETQDDKGTELKKKKKKNHTESTFQDTNRNNFNWWNNVPFIPDLLAWPKSNYYNLQRTIKETFWLPILRTESSILFPKASRSQGLAMEKFLIFKCLLLIKLHVCSYVLATCTSLGTGYCKSIIPFLKVMGPHEGWSLYFHILEK